MRVSSVIHHHPHGDHGTDPTLQPAPSAIVPLTHTFSLARAVFAIPTCDAVVTLSVSSDFKHHRLETARCGARRVLHAPLTMGASSWGDWGFGYVVLPRE
jgi:hypothetical protein